VRKLKKIAIIVFMVISIGLAFLSESYAREGCREGIICSDVGCEGGNTGCAIIPCNGYPILCLRP